MAALTGATIAASYLGLLKTSDSGARGAEGSADQCSDGAGNTIPLFVSATEVYAVGSGSGTSNTAFGQYAGVDLTGNYNTLYGSQAGKVLTSGANNVAVGRNALATHVDGSYNIAIGVGAMGDTDAGSTVDGAVGNVMIGEGAGGAAWANSAVNYNVGIGYESLRGVMTSAATGTVAIGYQSLNALTSGAGNTAIGYASLKASVDGSYNTALGYQAMEVFEAGSAEGQSVAIGYNAGRYISTGEKNTFIGAEAGQGVTGTRLEGDENVAIGKAAGTNLRGAAHSNTLVGADAGDAMTTALYNTAVGKSALSEVNTGAANIGIGAFAAGNTTTGASNVAIGAYDGSINSVLVTNTVGSYNIAIGTGAASTINENDNDGTVAIGHQACKVQAGTGGSQYDNATVGIGMNALVSLTTGKANTAVGHNAGNYNATGAENTYIGHLAGYGASGQNNAENTAVGASALLDITDGAGNTAVGKMALTNVTGGDYNVGIGRNAGQNINTGDDNIAIGYHAGLAITDHSRNIAIGRISLDAAVDGGGANTAVGFGTLSALNHDAADENVAIGAYAGEAATTLLKATIVGASAMGNGVATSAAEGTVAVGHKALYALTSGDGSTVIGYQAGETLTTGTSNTLIGYQAGQDVTGNHNTIIGRGAALEAADVDQTVIIGSNACDAVLAQGADGTVAIGYGALGTLTSGANNVAVGKNALWGHLTGGNNTAIGHNSMSDTNADADTASSHNNVFIGNDAGSGTWPSSDSNYNIGIGSTAMDDAMRGSTANVGIGYHALGTLQDGDYNVAIGYRALDANTDGSRMIAIGADALGVYNLTSDTEGRNIALGHDAGAQLATGLRNIIIGASAFDAANGSESDNIAIGDYSLSALDNDAVRNVAIGTNALKVLTTSSDGEGNVAIGYAAGDSLQTGDGNVLIGSAVFDAVAGDVSNCVAIGARAADAITGTSGNGTVAVGYKALTGLTSGESNTALGYQAAHNLESADKCTAIGYAALDNVAGALNDGNTAIGYNALGAAQISSGANVGRNTALGTQSGDGLAAGYHNIMIGYNAQIGDAAGFNQTAIGYNVTGVDTDNSVTIGNSDVTAVYMAQDKGAIVHCEDLRLGDNGSIGSATTADVITMAADGAVSIDSSSADGQYDTQLSVSGHGDERPTLQVQANDGSYAAGGIYGNIASNVVRAANTAYNFYVAWSDDGADIEFKVAGDGDVTADGSFTGSGADYAEFFESKDGEVIAIGTTVKLDGDKVVACSEGDTPIGVVRPKKVDNKASMTVGNTAWNRWTDKYLTDDFDRYILETDPNVDQDNLSEWDDGKRRKLNPDYDDTKEYKPREDRDEWHIIGLLGQIPITKGQPTGNWIKMKDVSDTVEMYFVK